MGLTHFRERDASRGGSAATSRASALAVRELTPALAARVQGGLLILAGLLGALGVALPHPPRFQELGMLGLQASAISYGCLLLVVRGGLQRVLVVAGPFFSTMGTAGVVILSGSASSPYCLFFLWVVFYAFYFLPSRQAIVHAAFAGLNYLAVVLVMSGMTVDDNGTNEWVASAALLVGTIALVGVFILTLQDRVGTLVNRLTEAATTDPLTGLRNRRGLQDALELERARAERSGNGFSLLLGDCDLFKNLNDSLGHEAGDRALVAIGEMLEEHRRRIDVAARIGGEEFAIVLPETEQHEAFLVAERLRIRLAEMFAGAPVPLTMSLGVASYPTHADSVDGLMRATDDALYAAKALGRDRSVLHSLEIAGIISSGRHGSESRAEAQLATVLNLAEALDMRDSGTARHSQTVGRYSELMARRLALPPGRVDRIRIAGVLHDIGKIGVADSILSKPGKLTDTEYEAMKKHPEIGARILGGSGLDDIRDWILAHHERPDGRGYPRGLTEAEIPLEARILAVADAYEAMTSDRVYRNAIGADAARAELRRWAGQQFDAEIVDVFLDALGVDPGSAPKRQARPSGR